MFDDVLLASTDSGGAAKSRVTAPLVVVAVTAVEAASDWGTYVCAHVYTSPGIRRCIAAGVKSIEHGQLADEDTVRLMADSDTWWPIKPFLADEDAHQYTDPKAIAALFTLTVVEPMIVENTSAVAVAAARELLWSMLGAPSPWDSHRLESQALMELGPGPDAAEGVLSFLQKRPPQFDGKVSRDMPDYFPWWTSPEFS